LFSLCNSIFSLDEATIEQREKWPWRKQISGPTGWLRADYWDEEHGDFFKSLARDPKT
jgi:hypothetical protein